ncbi:energy-coupling factor transport system ATP-binding protein [Scopulibacillus daqui]|uniref:Energy-coupling factor transport system ATP-binding protein n=1 Tax=Scopulibacillus daqui TaxID=1469162 RepID=A0ABS2PYW2_9BACL|nr:ABC transporter ATP-binding protein [Scopulibacillus daqui]MBM7645239.1 energy-coupling factor transport system ATP-binding protein [Scopulibacillus daqui]
MSLTNSQYGVTRLRLAFPKQKEMQFKDLTFHYQKGEKILMLGPSGCGKSTLMQVLCGLVPEHIEYPVKADEIKIPEKWGYVFQDPDSQFCMTCVDEEIAFVLENLQVPREKMPDIIHQKLKEAGLHLDDIHTPINQLSGGMKQRLATASALALDPDALFLDEPTAMLDPEGTEGLWEMLKDAAADKTVIIVEHKIDHVVNFVDRVVLFNDDGDMIADGTVNDIFKNYQHKLIEYGIWYPGVWQNEFGNKPEAADIFEGQPLIEIEDFTVYRKKTPKVHVNKLLVASGEWITIIGRNGAGKSTLLEGMMGLLPCTGKCKNLSDETDPAFVFQNPEFQFVTDKVIDELQYGLVIKKVGQSIINEKVNQALHQFSLAPHIRQHPFQLSVGQKRRLSVACSLLENPKIVLLDEPTFGQDAKNTFALLEHFEKLRQTGAAVIMVTHEMEIVQRFATRVLEIEDGKLKKDFLTARGHLLLNKNEAGMVY